MSDTFEIHPQLLKDSIVLLEMPLSTLLLANDSQYPWFILVPRRSEIKEIFQLDWEDQVQLLNESSMLSELIMQEFLGDKINVAALGNVVPQLHLHHIVRFATDKAWPGPIWGRYDPIPYSTDEIVQIRDRILPKVSAIVEKG